MARYKNLPAKYKSLVQSAIGYLLSILAVFLCVRFNITSTSYFELFNLIILIVVVQIITYIIIRLEIKLTFHMVEIPFWMGVVATLYGSYILHELRGIAFFSLLWGFSFLQGVASFRYMIISSISIVIIYLTGVSFISFYNLEPINLGQEIFTAFLIMNVLILLSLQGLRIQKQKEKIRRAQEEITHINNVALAINSSLNLDKVMKTVMDSLLGIFEFDQIGIGLIDENKVTIKLHWLYGTGYSTSQIEQLKKIRVSLAEKSYLVNLTILNRPGYIAHITPSVLKRYEHRELEIYNIAPHKSSLIYPLETHNEVIGLIALNNTKNPLNLTIKDLNHIQRYITQISIAINNAHVAEILLDKRNQMESLASKLSKYLSPQVYDSIFSGQIESKIKTKSKNLTVFFSDIEGYSSKFEDTDVGSITRWLNDYLDDMTKIVMRYEGTLDKFIGDAVMVFFGDPQTSGEKLDAINCVMMAMEMRDNARKAGVSIRMGIDSGSCIVGNFGSNVRMDYTIIGRSVNLADRLQSQSEPGQILISKSTYELIKDLILCKEHGEVTVKGFDQPISTFWVLDYKTVESV